MVYWIDFITSLDTFCIVSSTRIHIINFCINMYKDWGLWKLINIHCWHFSIWFVNMYQNNLKQFYTSALRIQPNTFQKQFHSVTIINLDFVSIYLRRVGISGSLKGEFSIAQFSTFSQKCNEKYNIKVTSCWKPLFLLKNCHLFPIKILKMQSSMQSTIMSIIVSNHINS